MNPAADVGRADPAPAVSVLVVTCDRRELLAECLESIAAQGYPRDRLEVLVFDNGSRDGTREWLRGSRPDVRLLEAPSNLGFAAPNNRCAEVARGRLLCLVNNDVRLEPGALAELVRARTATGAACIGARLLDASGQRVEFDGGVMNFHGHAAPRGHGEQVAGRDSTGGEPFRTLFACGGAMLVDRDVFLAAGGFDESYFAYFEDVDLGWRLRVLGEDVVIAPRALARHREHGSEALLPQGRRMALLEQNALLTAYKNYERPRGDRVFACALALLAERARLDPGRRAACEEGLAGAIARLPGAEAARRRIEEARRTRDVEIAPFFVEPFRPPIGGEAYLARQRDLAIAFDAADLFAAELPR